MMLTMMSMERMCSVWSLEYRSVADGIDGDGGDGICSLLLTAY